MEKELEKIHFSFLLQNCSFIMQDKIIQKFFESNCILSKGEKFVLNELFAFGELDKEIFSFEFIHRRSKAFKCTESHYINNTIKEVRKAMNCGKPLVLYFSNSMNSIINLISLLAFFETQHYHKDIHLVIFDESNKDDIIILKAVLDKYQKLYEEVIVNKDFSIIENLKINNVFLNAIKLYESFVSEDNDINKYIEDNKNMDMNILRKEIFMEFFEYGLNKLQIDALLNK